MEYAGANPPRHARLAIRIVHFVPRSGGRHETTESATLYGPGERRAMSIIPWRSHRAPLRQTMLGMVQFP